MHTLPGFAPGSGILGRVAFLCGPFLSHHTQPPHGISCREVMEMMQAKRPSAAARIWGSGAAPGLRGTVRFSPHGEGTLVTAELWGLPGSESGFFAMHVHETGDCRGEGFPNTGSHYDPGKREHPMHAGDLPPLLRRRDGRAWLAVVTDRFRPEDVVGRSVVIHSHPDDFRTQPSGSAGAKIGCGIIAAVGRGR